MITRDSNYCEQKPRVYSKERTLYIISIIAFLLELIIVGAGEEFIGLLLAVAIISFIFANKKNKFNNNYIKVLKAMGDDSYLDLETISDYTDIENIKNFLNLAITKGYFKNATIENGVFFIDEKEVSYYKNENVNNEELSKILELEMLSKKIINQEFRNEVLKLIENIKSHDKDFYTDDAIKVISSYIEIEKSEIKDKDILENIKDTISKINEKYDEISTKEMQEKVEDLKTDLYVLNTIIEG